MAQNASKYEGSKYKYVKRLHTNDNIYWALNIPNVTKKSYPTERDCAIAVDLYFISIGKKPLNILKAK